VKGLNSNYQKLISDMSVTAPIVLLQHVLQSLVAERISIRNLPKIAEVIAEASATTSNVSIATEYVRSKLAKQICQNLVDSTGFISVMVLDQNWDRELSAAVTRNGDEPNFVMSPTRVQEFVLAVRHVIQRFSAGDEWPALLVSPEVRPFVRSMLERVSPMTQVISHNEIHRKISVKTVATIVP
jgi:flagellar biosynthesis protein FlhA